MAEKNRNIGSPEISNIQGSTISIGNITTKLDAAGDIVVGDKATNEVAAQSPRDDSTQAILDKALQDWRKELQPLLDKLNDEDDKEYAEKTAIKVIDELKSEEIDPEKVEGFLKRLENMMPDILDVTAKTLQNPLAGIGLVFEKISDRIKLTREEEK